MDYPEGRYYKLNVLLLSLVGQSPYQNTFSQVLIATAFFGITALAAYMQITKLVIEKFDIRFIVDIVPSTMITLMCLIYGPFAYKCAYTKKQLLLALEKDWRRERPEMETAIKHKFAKTGQQLTLWFTAYVFSGITIVMLSGVYPQILNVLIPLNESRVRQHPFGFQPVIFQPEDFYVFLAMEYLAVITLMIFILASESTTVVLIQHASGTFAVIGYRLEHLMDNEKATTKCNVCKRDSIIKDLEGCIQEHRQILEFVAAAMDTAKAPALIALTGSVLCLSVSLTAVINPELLTNKTIPIGIGQLIQIFIMCYNGQFLSDASEEIADKSYGAFWYDFPLAAQKLILMMILRSSKPCEVSINDFCVLSMKNFSAVLQASMSYCMICNQFI